MKKYKPLGPNLIIKVDTKLNKIGSIYIAETDRENQAKTEATIVSLGDDAFDDLSEASRPKEGDKVVLARYEGFKLNADLDDVKEKQDFELRVVQDTRILALIEETE